MNIIYSIVSAFGCITCLNASGSKSNIIFIDSMDGQTTVFLIGFESVAILGVGIGTIWWVNTCMKDWGGIRIELDVHNGSN